MSNAQTIGLAAVVAIGSMLGLVWLGDRHDPELRQVVFTVDGAGGTVIVSIEADGELTSSQQAVPCHIAASVRNHAVFSITRTDEGTGPLEFEMKVDGELRGRTTSPRGALGRLEFSGTKVILSSITGL